MRIQFICFVYNEVRYLPTAIKYYERNGCDVYVIDNMSTDGTWQWLQNNRIPSHRFDTNGSFDLRLLQAEVMRTLERLRPDWVIYGAADLFYVFPAGIKHSIHAIDALGHNLISTDCWGALNTGEPEALPLVGNFWYWKYWKKINMIGKWSRHYNMNGDDVIVPDTSIYHGRSLCVNFGGAKPAYEQEIKLQRRQKAWDNGLRAATGRHYRAGKAKDWIYTKQECIDVRTRKDIYEYVQQILNTIK